VTTTGTGAPIRNVKLTLTGGPSDPEALQKLLEFLAARGIQVSAPAGGMANDAFFQSIRDQASARGLSMNNPDVQNALSAFDAANRSRFTAVSDASGHFKIADVLAGEYVLAAQREDYYRTSESRKTLVTNGSSADVQIQMIPGATISGRISNAAGRPLSYGIVEAIRIAYQNGTPVQQMVRAEVTDDLGEYRIFGLPPGEYLVSSGQPPMPFTAPAQLARTFYPGTRDVLSAVPINLRGGEERSGIDVRLIEAPSFRISGEITSSVTPPTTPAPAILRQITPTTASLVLLPADPSTPEGLARNFGTVNLTPAAGGQYAAHFDIDGVLPGIYDVGTWVRESKADGGSVATAVFQRVEVRDRNVEGVLLNLAPSVRVTGVVTADGRPLGESPIRVGLQPEGSAMRLPAYNGIATRPAVPNAQDGTFMAPSRRFCGVKSSASWTLYVSRLSSSFAASAR
jgi:hypothetical protein